MKELLLSILQAVIIAAVPVATAYLCQFLKTKKDETKAKINNQTVGDLLEDAFDAVIKAVAFTNQTYVDALKESGSFSVENQKEAFQISYNAAMSNMRQETKDFIATAYGGLNKWLTTQIESQVKTQKTEKPQKTIE